MSDAFAVAIDRLFAHFAVNAVYMPKAGTPRTVRVIVSQPDRTFESFDRAARTASCKIEVRTSEVADADAGDSVELDGVTYQIIGAPMRDAERLVWVCDAAEP